MGYAYTTFLLSMWFQEQPPTFVDSFLQSMLQVQKPGKHFEAKALLHLYL